MPVAASALNPGVSALRANRSSDESASAAGDATVLAGVDMMGATTTVTGGGVVRAAGRAAAAAVAAVVRVAAAR